jgi:hypothetical protein
MKLTSLQFNLQRKLGENAKLQNTQIDLQKISTKPISLQIKCAFSFEHHHQARLKVQSCKAKTIERKSQWILA